MSTEANKISDQDKIADPNQDEENIKDKFYLCRMAFYGMGMLLLIPSSFIPTANGYWLYKFRDPNIEWGQSNTTTTDLQSDFTSSYTIVTSVTSPIVIVLCMWFARKLSEGPQIIGGMIGIALMFIITTILVNIDTDSWQSGFLGLSLAVGFLLSASSGVFLVAMFHLVSRFPPKYLPLILSGQAICGIFSAIVQIISLSVASTPTATGFIYFLCGLALVLLTLAAFLLNLQKSDFFIFYYNKSPASIELKFDRRVLIEILKKTHLYLIAMALVLGSSIMIFPGVLALIRSVNYGSGDKWSDVYFSAVSTYLLHNVFDYIAREAAIKIHWPNNGYIILAASMLRIGLMPVLILSPKLFDNDCYYMIFVSLFGASHGYLVNMCLLRMGEVTEPEERKISNSFVMIFMIFGVAACSFVSRPLSKLVEY